MTTVTLLPANKRLKQLVKEHGARWRVLQEWPSLACFSGRPGLLIVSESGAHSRWVELDQVRRG
jgi:hypothetical protein